MKEYIVLLQFIADNQQHRFTKKVPKEWNTRPNQFISLLRRGLAQHGATDVQIGLEEKGDSDDIIRADRPA